MTDLQPTASPVAARQRVAEGGRDSRPRRTPDADDLLRDGLEAHDRSALGAPARRPSSSTASSSSARKPVSTQQRAPARRRAGAPPRRPRWSSAADGPGTPRADACGSRPSSGAHQRRTATPSWESQPAARAAAGRSDSVSSRHERSRRRAARARCECTWWSTKRDLARARSLTPACGPSTDRPLAASAASHRRGRRLRDEREDARRAARPVRQLQHADEDPGAERRQLRRGSVRPSRCHTPRGWLTCAMDHEVRADARVDAQGVDAQPHGAALLDQEAGGVRAEAREAQRRRARRRSAPDRC